MIGVKCFHSVDTGYYTQQCVKEARDHCQTAMYSTNDNSKGSQYWPRREEQYITEEDVELSLMAFATVSVPTRVH